MKSLLESVYLLALEAGAEIMRYYADDIAVELKVDKSPVTAADKAANRIIMNGLQILTPDIPVLSEESEHAHWQERKHWDTFWLVDPLDGTKEFIRKNGEFTVNIALINAGKPVLGVVYAPALATGWLADGQRAWRENRIGREQIRVTTQVVVPVVVGSRSHPSPEMAGYLEVLGEHRALSVGSSLKFCMVAEGKAQLYPRLGPTMMWDTAAGQCIADSAGAKVTQLDGRPLQYHREALLNPYFEVSVYALGDYPSSSGRPR